MKLHDSIQQLLNNGSVVVGRNFDPFDPNDLKETIVLLKNAFENEKKELPVGVPEFEEQAAIWAAAYFYKTCQLILLREKGDEVIDQQLLPFTGIQNPEAIYSADLVFRYLPDLFLLAKGLAPDDLLVLRLKQTAGDWPFSAVGIDGVEHERTDMLLDHPFLKTVWLDRIINKKSHKWLINPKVKERLDEIFGMHQQEIWPELQIIPAPILNEHN